MTKVAIFAGHQKLFSEDEAGLRIEEFQKALSKLDNWTPQWQIKFTIDKCKVMRIGRNNLNYLFTLMNFELAVTSQEGHLGIITNSSMKAQYAAAAVKKANKMLG